MSELRNVVKMDLKEFIEKGYLQEANRRFFHPLGLALAVNKKEDGSYEFDSVWDSRDDPEGFVFGDFTDEDFEKAEQVFREWDEKAKERQRVFGFTVQPLKVGLVKRLEE